VLIRGDPSAARLAVFHLDERDRMLAVEAVNAPPEFMVGRLLLASGARADRARLADPSASMKQVTL
jgi:3-phenylpropionate/trans-cinnamate dioxygenase ferredoxin reductase subunit